MRRNEKTAQDLLTASRLAARFGLDAHIQDSKAFASLIEKVLTDEDHPLLQVVGTVELKGYHRGYTAGIKARREASGPDVGLPDLEDAIERLEHLVGQMRDLAS